MKIVYFLLKLCVTVVLFYWLIVSNKLDFKHFQHITWSFSIVFLLVAILSHLFIQAIRWKYVANFYGITISYRQAVMISWIGNFFSLFLPGASSGEILRGYYIYKIDPGKTAIGISSIIVDRILGFFIFASFTFCACIYISFVQEKYQSIEYLLWFSLLVLISLCIILPVLTSKKMMEYTVKFFPKKIKTIVISKMDYSSHRNMKSLIIAILLSVISTSFAIYGFMFAADVLQSPIDGFLAFLYAPIIIMSNTLPISPGGVGVAESVSAMLFIQDGYLNGAEIMLLYRIGISFLRLPGGLIFLLYK